MVCFAVEQQNIRCHCCIEDGDGKRLYQVDISGDTSIGAFVQNVALNTNHDPSSIKLILLNPNSPISVLTEDMTTPLLRICQVGLGAEQNTRNCFVLEEMKREECYNTPEPAAKEEDGGGGDAQFMSYSPSLFNNRFLRSSSEKQQPSDFVGLVNQAMTCYLNSLLQALFMTPEFRNALYKWKYEGNKPTKSIPYQLQKLFVNLQTSKKAAIETIDLTVSFGWGRWDVWHQHDVQELCRVMFDALEQDFKNTSQADLINQLYQGKMIDYVKCLECGTEKSREDSFLDIPLPVRPFESTIAYGSIEEALKAFVEPETLDGANQYYCESCDKKCDAHKGLKFSQLPYVLTLHLKRFDIDYLTFRRIKLNDKVVFPEMLDLGHFMDGNEGVSMEDESGRCDDCSTADSALGVDSGHTDSQSSDQIQPNTPTSVKSHEEDEGIEVNARGLPNETKSSNSSLETENPSSNYVYELFSIMIHSGSASGGHYYAYIKDFSSDKWYCFNDQSVTQITREDIEKSYGGGPSRGYYSGVYSSSTNAYMLMYRLVDKERNTLPMKPEEFPSHIKSLVDEISEAEERLRVLKARQGETLKIYVLLDVGRVGTKYITKQMFLLHRDKTLVEAFVTAHKGFKELYRKTMVPVQQCRLVTAGNDEYTYEYSFEGREVESIGSIINWLKKNNASTDFVLETRTEDQEFTPYTPDDFKIKVYLTQPDCEEISSIEFVQVSPTLNVKEFRQTLKQILPYFDPSSILVAYRSLQQFQKSDHCTCYAMLDDDSAPITNYFFNSPTTTYSSKLFVAPLTTSLQTDLEGGFFSSKFIKFLEKIRRVIIINVILPQVSEDLLEKLLIPPLSEQKVNMNNNKSETTQQTGEAVVSGVEEEVLLSGLVTSDQSTSEDSSLTDSDRTIVGEPVMDGHQASPTDPADAHLLNSQHNLNVNHDSAKDFEMFKIVEEDLSDSPEENLFENVEDNLLESGYVPITEREYYFKASPYVFNNENRLKLICQAYVEMSRLLKDLEGWTNVESKYLMAVNGPDESELVPGSACLSDNDVLTLKLHRPLLPNEKSKKVSLFQFHEPSQFLCDWIVKTGETVADTKKSLLKYLEKRGLLTLPINRCRLWKKRWDNISRPLLDNEVWDENDSFDLVVEKLEGDEVFTSTSQRLVFFVQWHPSTRALGTVSQVIVEASQPSELPTKLSELSGIPVEHLKMVICATVSPHESHLTDPYELDWDNDTAYINSPDFTFGERSSCIIYRDGREEYSTTEDVERARTVSRRRLLDSSSATVSPRKEKPLRIFLDKAPADASCYIPPPDYE